MSQNIFEISGLYVLRTPKGSINCAFPTQKECWKHASENSVERMFYLQSEGWICEYHKLALEKKG